MVARKEDRALIYMDAEDFNAALEHALGPGAQSVLARITGISRSQVNRYANGLSKVPKYVALILVLIGTMRAAEMTIPEPPVRPRRPTRVR
jgi:hypothetical protein